MGMKESADESDLLCLRSPGYYEHMILVTGISALDEPNITLQQFKTQMILSRGALYDLILRSSGDG